MSTDERRIEIFDVCGTNAGELFLLVHVEEVPDEEDTYYALVLRLNSSGLAIEHRLSTWSTSFWRSPSGMIYVADVNGQMHSNWGGRWQATTLSTRYPLNAVWGLSDTEVYCSGHDSQFYRKSGADWDPFNAGLRGDLYGIGGTGRENLFVLSEAGVLFHTAGGVWSEIPSPTNVNLIDVFCVSENEAYICGWKGVFFLLKDGRWGDFSLESTETNLYRIARFREEIYVGSAPEGLFHFDGHHLASVWPDIAAIGVRVVGDRLFAFGETTLHSFDGNSWKSINLDFDRVIP